MTLIKEAKHGHLWLSRLSLSLKTCRLKCFLIRVSKQTEVFDIVVIVEMIERVMELANQLQNQVNLMALDALRNLFVQAHLVDSP